MTTKITTNWFICYLYFEYINVYVYFDLACFPVNVFFFVFSFSFSFTIDLNRFDSINMAMHMVTIIFINIRRRRRRNMTTFRLEHGKNRKNRVFLLALFLVVYVRPTNQFLYLMRIFFSFGLICNFVCVFFFFCCFSLFLNSLLAWIYTMKQCVGNIGMIHQNPFARNRVRLAMSTTIKTSAVGPVLNVAKNSNLWKMIHAYHASRAGHQINKKMAVINWKLK